MGPAGRGNSSGLIRVFCPLLSTRVLSIYCPPNVHAVLHFPLQTESSKGFQTFVFFLGDAGLTQLWQWRKRIKSHLQKKELLGLSENENRCPIGQKCRCLCNTASHPLAAAFGEITYFVNSIGLGF